METGSLGQITAVDQLLVYLRDELDWPLEGLDSDSFEEISYHWDLQEDLHLKPEQSAKIREVRQLPPLVTNQPWGIFYISFEDKAVRIGPLRQILRALVVTRREMAKGAELQKWQLNDILFISTFGASGERQLCFAHFHQDPETVDLPILRVLGWNDKDTRLHLADVHDKLRQYLRWPEDPSDFDIWREQWSKPFRHRPGEVISTSKDLAVALADLARRIRESVEDALNYQTEEGSMRRLMGGFKENLIHDLDDHRFADMFAQTISYGLLTAKFSRPAGLIAHNLVDMVPSTNPFLRELFETFFSLGGRSKRDALDFDVLGIRDVVDMLNEADTEAVKRDFGDRNPDEDPTIHFYELFLKEFDPGERIRRGVYYTPRPVVTFIVRSVDEILQREYGLKDGLADTTTWGKLAAEVNHLKIPEGTSPDEPFVQILDPAVGTGTFLVEVIDLIEQRMKGRWNREGKNEEEIIELWNDYVPNHLLSRLTGFELMMAPYAIAHMKLGLKLANTEYKFRDDVRAKVYLTNTLAPAHEVEPQFEEFAPALAHEAQAVNTIKNHNRFTVVIGNPPYSIQSQNLSDAARQWVDPYRYVENKKIVERNALQFEKNIQDDYIKFIRFSQVAIESSGVDLVGLVTNHGYLDGATFRGMRWSLMQTFTDIHVLNLHGNSNKREIAPDGSSDENVFDISQGVAVSLMVRRPTNEKACEFNHADLWGMRTSGSTGGKYGWLMESVISSVPWESSSPSEPLFLFKASGGETEREYQQFIGLTDIMPIYSMGVKSSRDGFVIDFEPEPLLERIKRFRSASISNEDICNELGISQKKGWNVSKARQDLRNIRNIKKQIIPFLYRPFDFRLIFYHKGVVFSSAYPVMRHLLSEQNVALVVTRQTKDQWDVQCTRTVTGHKSLGAYDANSVFPLYLYESDHEDDLEFGNSVNMSPGFLVRLGEVIDISGNDEASISPEDAFNFAYALFHSQTYRDRYADFLKTDFPRIPLPGSSALFDDLVELGRQLIAVQLLDESKVPALRKPSIRIAGSENTLVATGYPKFENGRIFINPKRWFEDVPEKIWNFRIGGYQPCQRWIKDRAGKSGENPKPNRILTKEDIRHYTQIVTALGETFKLMEEIDRTINKHGGWPDAFYIPPPPPPSIEEIIQADEGKEVEYKSTFQWDVEQGRKNKELQKASLKTVAAFLNSGGGMLVIGVTDDKEIYGLEKDFALMSKDDNKEWFRQTVVNAINRTLGEVFANSYEFRFSDAADGKEVFIIDVKERGPKPAFLKFDKGQDDEFFVRTDNQTVRLTGSKQYEYIQAHW